MNKYEHAIYCTVTEDEGLYEYFKDIWEDCESRSRLAWELRDYFEGLTNHIPWLYENLVNTMLNSNLVDFYIVAENLVDLF